MTIQKNNTKNRENSTSAFPDNAPCGDLMYSRSYSRIVDGKRETWNDTCERVIAGVTKIGKLSEEESVLLLKYQKSLISSVSGRYLWVGGTPWLEQKNNFEGAYNCTSLFMDDWRIFALLFDLAMKGTGTGSVMTMDALDKLEPVCNRLEVKITGEIGALPKSERSDDTTASMDIQTNTATIVVGDSRKGWVDALDSFLKLVHTNQTKDVILVNVDLSNVRTMGEPLVKFGGVANPIKLPDMFVSIAEITNNAYGRRITPSEATYINDLTACVVVAGNIRRTASIHQYDHNDVEANLLKKDLYTQDEHGKWSIDPKKQPLTVANHTRIFHHKPSLIECIESVGIQVATGEGAMAWYGEAVARCNADILNSETKKKFLELYDCDRALATSYLAHRLLEKESNMGADEFDKELNDRMSRFGANPCHEIIGANFLCNLATVFANRFNPYDLETQIEAFKVAGINISSLLHHEFEDERLQYSREVDPIVGASVTGLFDFFVNLFGTDWVRWWCEDRSDVWDDVRVEYKKDIIDKTANVFFKAGSNYHSVSYNMNMGEVYHTIERSYLELWKESVHDSVQGYCERNGLRVPNRYTTVQPSGSLSLLTGASPGVHAPKGSRYLRRMTFAKDSHVMFAAIDYGYTIIPAQNAIDENGNLITDPWDSRVTEVLVQIPVEVEWANLPGMNDIDITSLPALSQFDFLSAVQLHYTTHTTSVTLEAYPDEVEALGTAIYENIQADGGYIAAAIMGRSRGNSTFPNMPFAPITKEEYDKMQAEVLERRKDTIFSEALTMYDPLTQGFGSSGCDSDKCLFPEKA